jgi:hypothetical protein
MNGDKIDITSGGGSLNVAGSTVGGKNNRVSISGGLNIGPSPSKDELIAALRQLRAELDKAHDLPADKADDLKDHADAAIKAVDRDKPNKDRTLEKLTTMQKILDGLKGSVGSALALGKLVGEVILVAKGLGM